jgi:uncharacterized protein DUF3592
MLPLKEFLFTGRGIVSFVFLIVFGIFLIVGALLAALDSPRQGGSLFMVVGAGGLAVGLGLGLARLSEMRRRERLLRSGKVTQAVAVKVSKNYKVRVNRQHPTVVSYQYEVEGAKYERSEPLMESAEQYVEGGKLEIMYDVEDPRHSTLKPRSG